MRKILTEIIKKQTNGELSLFDVPPQDQKSFLDSLPAPENIYERSYNQYKCQSFFRSKTKLFLFFIIGLFGYPIFMVIALGKGIKKNRKTNLDAVGNFKTLPEIIPNSLTNEFDIDVNHWGYSYSLSFRDLAFVLKLWRRYPSSTYFQLKCLMNIAIYSHIIRSYSPRAIIGHSEFSFTSSVLTAYCRDKKIEHINVMHGEKLFNIRDSHFEYDRFYIWNEHYKELFIELKAVPKQFIVEVPPSLSFDTNKYFKTDAYAEFKYYLTDQDEDQLSKIVQTMEKLKAAYHTVKYRPHPTYSNMEMLKKYISDSEIEDTSKVNILSSLSSLDYAVGVYSTTLLQAQLVGKEVIMDDVVYTELVQKLKDYKYILAHGKVSTLSELINSQ